MSHAGGEKDDRSDGQEAGPTIDYDPGVARVGMVLCFRRCLRALYEKDICSEECR